MYFSSIFCYKSKTRSYILYTSCKYFVWGELKICFCFLCRRSETTSSSKRPSQSVVQVDAQGRRFLIAYPAPVDKLETKPDILNPKSGKLHNFFTKTIFVFLSSTIIFMHKKLGLGSLISQKSISNIIMKQHHHHNVPAFFLSASASVL